MAVTQVLCTGGSRSGNSAFARHRVEAQADAQLREHPLAVTALARRFGAMHGWVNQQFAAACSAVCLLVSGLPLMCKGTALKEFSCAING